MLARDPTNLWMQTAIQSSLAEGAGNLFAILAGDARVVNQTVGQDWLLQLAAMIGVRGRPGEAAQVLDFTERLAYQPQAAFALLYALGDGLHWARSSLARADPQMRLQPLYSQAAAALQNVLIPESLRIAGIEVLGVAPFTLSSIGDVLVLQLGSSQSEAFQSAVLATLGRFDDPRVAPALIRRWRVLTPRARSEAYTALLSRADRLVAVLTALENGNVGAADLSSEQVDFLRTYRDPAIRQRALQFFGPVPMQRPQAVQRFRPALSLEGTPARGRDIFRALCAACHSASRGSQAFGPQLASVRIYGKENILRAILEPNAEVRRDYLTYVLETVWGEALTGLLRNENPITITIEPSAGGPVVLPRLNIQYLQAQSWSLMPESLDDGLTPQDMADLLEYVMTGAR
jgi:putative heme-binding domain-containing protein